VHPHNDHLHVELTSDGAALQTPWFLDGLDGLPPQSAFTGDYYLAGDWDGDGRGNIAVRRGNDVLMDDDFDGTHDLLQSYGTGDGEDEYLVGDWDGDGRDNVAVRRDNQVLMDYDFDGSANFTQGYGRGNE
jgi:hypothetical protein